MYLYFANWSKFWISFFRRKYYLGVFKIKTSLKWKTFEVEFLWRVISLKWSDKDKVVSIQIFLFDFETVLQYKGWQENLCALSAAIHRGKKHRPFAHISLMNLRSVKSMGEVDEILITRRALHLESLYSRKFMLPRYFFFSSF